MKKKSLILKLSSLIILPLLVGCEFYSLEETKKPSVSEFQLKSNPKSLTLNQKEIKPDEKLRIGIIDSKILSNYNLNFLNLYLSKDQKQREKLSQLDAHSMMPHGAEVIYYLNFYLEQFGIKNYELYICDINQRQSIESCLQELKEYNLHYLNISLSGKGQRQTEFDLLKEFSDNQTVITVAAGNDGSYERSYPCAYKIENLVCVGSLKDIETLNSWSNFGPHIKAYAEAPNTSMASPSYLAKIIAIRPEIQALNENLNLLDCNTRFLSYQGLILKSTIPKDLYLDYKLTAEQMDGLMSAIKDLENQTKLSLFSLKGVVRSDLDLGQTEDGVSVIYNRRIWKSSKIELAIELATTSLYYNSNQLESDISINSQNYEFAYNKKQLNEDRVDFKSLMIHELLHSLGIKHDTSSTSVMNPTLAKNTVRTKLSPSDLKIFECF